MVINFNQIDPSKNAKGSEQADKSDVTQELQRINDLKNLQNKADTKSYENAVRDAKQLEALRNEKGYEAKLQKDKGTKILSDLMTDLSKIGMEFAPKTRGQNAGKAVAEEMDILLSNKEVKDDKTSVKDNVTREAVKRTGKHEEKERGA